MLLIEVENLVKQYKNGVRALDGLCLTVGSGEIFSLLGPNGAGKSSLINILTTYVGKTSGIVKVLGQDIEKNPAFIRRQIACVAQQTSVDVQLSLTENMLFQSKLYQVPADTAKVRMAKLIQTFSLADYLKYPVSSYSGGVKRRLDIAMNMMSGPKILFLDEPTVGMDVQSRMAMWEMMRKICGEFGTTIFLTTHYLEEAERLAHTICMIKDGREIVQASPETLRKEMWGLLRIRFSAAEQAEACANLMKDGLDLKSVSVKENCIVAEITDGQSELQSASRWLLQCHMEFSGIEIVQPNLEDIFLRLMGKRGKGVAR